jgi:hypothetical protein
MRPCEGKATMWILSPLGFNLAENSLILGALSSLTYLLTFNCYGTRLPGDSRGSVDRARRGDRGGPIFPSVPLESHAREQQDSTTYRVNAHQAAVILEAIKDVCIFRAWSLLAAHVRTTHVHAVVGQVENANRVIAGFKAYASRALNRTESNARRWAREGSTRPLRTRAAVNDAIRYVAEGQGPPMALYVSGL